MTNTSNTPNPQLEGGYTRIANELLEGIIRIRIPGEQMQCFLFIIRQTYGFNNKSAIIKNSEFVEATGILKQNINRTLKSLESKNIIKITTTPDGKKYTINKYFHQWEKVIKSDYSNQKRLPKKSNQKRLPKVIKSDYSSNQKRLPYLIKDNIKKEKIKEKDKKEIKPTLNLKKYLNEKIQSENLIEFENKIIEFFDYRQNEIIKGKKQPFKTKAGLNGLFRQILNCQKLNFDIPISLEIAIENQWLIPNPEYYKNFSEVKVQKQTISGFDNLTNMSELQKRNLKNMQIAREMRGNGLH